MELREIIESGILELYVLNRLSDEEVRQVETYIQQYPELAEEIQAIERAFFAIGRSVELPIASEIKEAILARVRGQFGGTSRGQNPLLGMVSSLLAIGLLAALYFWNSQRHQLNELQSEMVQNQIDCDSVKSEQSAQLARFNQIYSPNNKILAFQATENYPETQLYLHTNAASSTNFIQIQGLPAIAANQAYQLWSLKGNDPPRPLDVFQHSGALIEVDFIEGTNAYAITIEDRDGAETPNLDQLIGVVNVSS